MISPRRLHQILTALLQLAMAVGLAITIYERNWLNAVLIALILLVTLAPAMLGRRFEVRIPIEFEVAANVFIFASLFLGEIRGYYLRYWWWDAALHTGSGFLLGLLGFLLVYALNREEHIHLHMQPFFVALFAFAFAVAAGAVWEIFEFAMDHFFGLNMQKNGLRDTMWDLIVDAVGAIVVSSLGWVYMKTGERSFVMQGVEKFVESNPRLFRRSKS